MFQRIILSLAFIAGLSSLAEAQCSGGGGVPFNCVAAPAPPVAADVFLGGSAAGANTVKFTAAQLAAGLSTLMTPGCTTNCTMQTLSTSAGITDTMAAAANTYGFISTSGLSFMGTICAPGTNGCVLDNEITYTENATAAVRMRYLFDTIVNNGTTTGFDEGMFLGRHLTGTGTYTQEVNGYHGYIQVDAGVTDTAANLETFESSTSLGGNIATFASYLAIPTVTPTGVVGSVVGSKYGLTNNNPTVGALAEWDAIYIGPISGSGSAITHNFAFKNLDPKSTVATLGNVVIGKNADAQSQVMLQIYSTINTGFTTATTYPIFVTSAGSQNIFTLRDSGDATIRSGLSVGATGSASGNVTMFNAGTGSAKIFAASGLTTSANIAIPASVPSSDTFALLGTPQTFTALPIFKTHIAATRVSAYPVITGGTVDANASDVTGTVTGSSSVTSIVITFEAAYATTPHVTVSAHDGLAFTYTISTTALTISFSSASGRVFDYAVMQ